MDADRLADALIRGEDLPPEILQAVQDDPSALDGLRDAVWVHAALDADRSDVNDAIMARIRTAASARNDVARKRRSPRRLLPWVAVAALLLIGVLPWMWRAGATDAAIAVLVEQEASGRLLVGQGSSARLLEPGGSLPADRVIRIHDAAAVLQLADGSRLACRPGTSLRLSAGATGVQCHLLAGESRFRIAVRSAPALRVSTPHLEAQVLGTDFTVRVAGDHDRVQVHEGLVAVRGRAGGVAQLGPDGSAESRAGQPLVHWQAHPQGHPVPAGGDWRTWDGMPLRGTSIPWSATAAELDAIIDRCRRHGLNTVRLTIRDTAWPDRAATVVEAVRGHQHTLQAAGLTTVVREWSLRDLPARAADDPGLADLRRFWTALAEVLADGRAVQLQPALYADPTEIRHLRGQLVQLRQAIAAAAPGIPCLLVATKGPPAVELLQAAAGLGDGLILQVDSRDVWLHAQRTAAAFSTLAAAVPLDAQFIGHLEDSGRSWILYGTDPSGVDSGQALYWQRLQMLLDRSR